MKLQTLRQKARFLVLWAHLRPKIAAIASATYIVDRQMHRPPIVPLVDLTDRPRILALTAARHIWTNTAATTHMLMAHMHSSQEDNPSYVTTQLGAIPVSRTHRTILNKVLEYRRTFDFSILVFYSVQTIPEPGRHTSSAKQRNYVFPLDLLWSLAVFASHFTVLCVYSLLSELDRDNRFFYRNPL